MKNWHHIYFGYVSSISPNEYEANKNAGYTMNDQYGKNGIEYVFEKYLKGKNGIKQIDMSVDRSCSIRIYRKRGNIWLKCSTYNRC